MKTKLFLMAFLTASVIGFSQTTYVPDNNFEQALIDLGYDDVLDDYVANSNINSITTLNLTSKNISDLRGISGFTVLRQLYITDNNLTSIDISSNSELGVLYCGKNNLNELDLSSNRLLQIVHCYENNLSVLDISNNADLHTLYAYSNNLTTLNTSNNPDLKFLSTGTNKITALDFSENKKLENLYCRDNSLSILNVANGKNTILNNFSATGNPNLACIQIDNTNNIGANWTKDATASYSDSCLITAIPDNNFEQALIDLGYDSGTVNGSVPTVNISGITSLQLSYTGISDLTGIEDFIALTSLTVVNNNLTTLDLSTNTALTSLVLYNNELTSLNITNNPLITYLYLSDNQIENLDLSKNIALELLHLDNNKLTTLDVSKNTALTDLYAVGNLLTNLDVSNNKSLKELVCYYNKLTDLDISSNVALNNLLCYDNNLTSLNLKNGNNDIITSFNATNNPDLTCIQVDNTNNIGVNWNKDAIASYSESCITNVPDDNFEQALIDLGYDDVLDNNVTTANINGITSLNINGKSITDLTGIENFTALEFLGAHNNNLTTVDLTNNLELNNLSIYTNQLTALDLSKNTKLTRVNCDYNEITALDLSKNDVLVDVSCQTNKLTLLNIKNGNNTNIIYFAAYNNPNLSCIEVDNIAYTATNSWASISGKGATASYSEDCSATASVVDNVFNNAISLYPNPVKNTLHINIANGQDLEKLQVFNLLGKKIVEQKSTAIDFSEISAGIYVLKIKSTAGKIATRKVVKH